jgi:hypothetical protein
MRSVALAAAIVVLAVRPLPVTERVVPHEPLIQLGNRSQVHTFTALVVRTPAEWQRLWTMRVQPAGAPAVAPPRVDFSKTMVIAVFAGDFREGTSVVVDKVVESRGRLVVSYRIDTPSRPAAVPSPAAGELTPPLSSPYTIVGVPRSTLPVVFVQIGAVRP